MLHNSRLIILKFINLKIVSAVIISLALILLLLSFSASFFSDTQQLAISMTMKTDFAAAQYVSLELDNGVNLKSITQIIKNHDFSQDLEHWSDKGEVAVSCETQAEEGLCFVQLGLAGSSNLIQENCISQQLNIHESPPYLGLRYQYSSEENLLGFDETAWIVLLDDQVIYTHPSQQVPTAPVWQWQVIPLPNLEQGAYSLQICAGNSGDRNLASWIKFQEITTFLAVMNSTQQLQLQAVANHQLILSYADYATDKTISTQPASQHLFQPSQSLNNDLLTVSLFTDEEMFDEFELPLFYLDQQPAIISDLQAYNLSKENFIVTFTSPTFNHWLTDSYFLEVKYSEQPFFDQSWSDANQAQQFASVSKLSLYRPVCLQEICFVQVSTNNQEDDMYFSAKLCNLTGQCSAMSNLALSK